MRTAKSSGESVKAERRAAASVTPTVLSIIRVVVAVFVVALSPAMVVGQTETVLWSEGWEGSWIFDWSVTGGTWEVGAPSSGPGNTIEGAKCAATVLAGDYPEGVNSQLKRETTFVVPPASQNPRLRFWQWYSFSCGDYGEVQIRSVAGGSWTTIADTYTWSSCDVWSRAFVDLSAWADSTVQIAFYFHSENVYSSGCAYGDPDVSSGWYIDLVEVVSDPIPPFGALENWESGPNHWYVSHGIWEIGTPTSGPSAHEGANCAATVLDGPYCDGLESRLISPAFTVPAASEMPRLRFWHWYDLSCGDYGEVQVRSAKSGSWTTISDTYTGSPCDVWSRAFVDLSAWADSTVQVAFSFHSENVYSSGCGYGDPDVGDGWYVDEVEIEAGFITPFDNPEYWESGIDDWYASHGIWQVGTPTTGPGAARGGLQCAATVLDGNYCDDRESRLVSPPFVVPAQVLSPRFTFWHWFSLSCGDYGEVQIREIGGPWITLSEQYVGEGAAWTLASVDLQGYATKTVQLAFDFHSVNVYSSGCGYGNPDVSSGWYIDDILLIGAQTPTFLRRYEAVVQDDGVEIRWELSEAGQQMEFSISREDISTGELEELDAGNVTNTGMSYSYVDTDYIPGESYRYRVYVADEEGRRMLFETEAVATTALAAKLEQNVPNPFNPMTTISYTVGKAGHVSLKVYDTSGAMVKTLYEGERTPGRYGATWDGRNARGDQVATGVYFYRMKTGKFVETKKMVLIN